MKNTCKIFFLLIAYHLWLITPSYAQNYRWAYGFGGSNSNSHGNSIATDTNANVYATGYFGDTIDFDPSTGIFLLNSDFQKMFVTKYDSAGVYQWAITTEGAGISSGNSIAVNSTGVYVTGEFYGTLDFDPSPATYNLQSNNQSADVFIAKYSLSGSLVWAINMGGPDNDVGNSIAIDDTGNVYVAGNFRGTADFDPNTSIANLVSDTLTDAFFGKYDFNGNLIWVHDLCDGNGAAGGGAVITLDKINNHIYVSGSFRNTVDFDRGPGTYYLTDTTFSSRYIVKYDSSGSFVWAGIISAALGLHISDIYVNETSNNDIYICGFFRGVADFDLYGGIYGVIPTSNNFEIYFAKYSSNGILKLIKHTAGTSSVLISANSIVVDITGDICLTGYFDWTTDFDPGLGSVNITSNGLRDIFFAKYDTLGNYIWARGLGGLYTDVPNSITLDLSGSVYLTGYFTNTIDADPGTGTAMLSPAISENIFIAKYDNTFTNITSNQLSANGSLQLYPNPASNFITVLPQSATIINNQFSVIDVNGKELIKGKLTTSLKINIATLADGIYVLKVKSPTNVSYQKFIKTIA